MAVLRFFLLLMKNMPNYDRNTIEMQRTMGNVAGSDSDLLLAVYSSSLVSGV